MKTLPLISDYQPFFSSPVYESFNDYLKGLTSQPRNFSVLGISSSLKMDYDRLDYFISRAHWSERQMNRYRIAQHFQQINDRKIFSFILDDSGMRKFTNAPFYVGKSYIGNLGKVDLALSCVFGCFTTGGRVMPKEPSEVIPVDFEVYLPASKLIQGCQDLAFRSKIELAESLINRAIWLARELDIEIDYFLFDCWYAANKLLNLLSSGHLKYVTEIRTNRIAQIGDTPVRVDRLVMTGSPENRVVEFRGKSYQIQSQIIRLRGVDHLVRLMVVTGRFGKKKQKRYFITNDLSAEIEALVEVILRRWKIDYLFRETKTYLALDEGKFHKLRCYLRHFYLVFLVWSLIRIGIIWKQFSHAKTICGAIRSS